MMERLMQGGKKFILLVFLFISLVSFSNVYAATKITTSIDRQQIANGETFKLTITIGGQANSDAVDTSALEKDFLIISSMVSPQMTIINGEVNQRTYISFVLAPKHSGKLTIPPITIGNFASAPQTIQVSATATHATTTNKTAFLDVSVDNKTPLVQSQITYRIRLFYATTLSRGSLSEPAIENALIMPLGDDKDYQKTLDGTPYQVHERSYAIFPQQSGKLTLEPITFSGVKSANNHYQNQYTPFFDATEPVRLISPTVTLDIKPIPQAVRNQEWLPSKNLQLTESWRTQHEPARAGEPITRTIAIKAFGITAAQLPKIDFTSQLPANVNVYPDNPNSKNSIENDNVVAEWQQTVAYIPTQAGDITLPEIAINWWDTVNNKLHSSKLPSKTFQLQASSLPHANESVQINTTKEVEQVPMLVNSNASKPRNIWPYVALSLLIAWLGSLFFIYYKRRNNSVTRKNSETLSNKQILRQLKAACQQQNALQVKCYLEAWAKTQWPEKSPMNLGRIAQEILDPTLLTELEKLSTHLYSPKATPWDGEFFWQAFQFYQSKKPRRNISQFSDLPPLNPSSQL